MPKRARNRRDGRKKPSSTDERLVAMTKAIQQNAENNKKLAAMLGRQEAQLAIFAQSAEGIDNNVLALAEMMKEVFGQITQIDEFFKIIDFKKDGKPLDELADPEVVKATAMEWYQDVMTDAFKKVKKRMEEHRAQQEAQKVERERQAQEKAAEAQKALEDTRERATMETERQATESNPLAQPQALDRPHIPDGAHVFGG